MWESILYAYEFYVSEVRTYGGGEVDERWV
jgi:hypothetical protein